MGGIFCPLKIPSGVCPLGGLKIRPVFYRGDKKPLGLRPGFGEKRLKSGFLALNKMVRVRVRVRVITVDFRKSTCKKVIFTRIE